MKAGPFKKRMEYFFILYFYFCYLLYLLVAPANSTYITKDLNLY